MSSGILNFAFLLFGSVYFADSILDVVLIICRIPIFIWRNVERRKNILKNSSVGANFILYENRQPVCRKSKEKCSVYINCIMYSLHKYSDNDQR